jgi:hypothetical protein
MPHHADRWPWWMASLAHPFVVIGANLPWAGFALLSLRPGFAQAWDDRGRRLLQALHCWAWPSLLFWSVVPEHALRHSMPLFPALSGLAAMVWWRWLRGGAKRQVGVFVVLMSVCLLAKVVFVEVIVPGRNPNRAPRAKGDHLDRLVPRDRPLYVSRLKDEGILFYFGRSRPLQPSGPPVRKVDDLEVLLSQCEPVYCILDAFEWQRWSADRKADLIAEMQDEQRAAIYLVRTRPRTLRGGEEESGR